MVTLFVKCNQIFLIFSRFSDFSRFSPIFDFPGFPVFSGPLKSEKSDELLKIRAIYESSIPLEHTDRNKTKNNSQ